MFHEAFPDEDLAGLVDYYGLGITDALAVGARFPERARGGRLAFRLDTHGGRYCEGLDLQDSYAVLDRHVPGAIRGYRTEGELRHLVGTGVSAAASWYLRENLDSAGFPTVRHVASSGFPPEKCHVIDRQRVVTGQSE